MKLSRMFQILWLGALSLCLTGCPEEGGAPDYGTAPATDPAYAMKLAAEQVAIGDRWSGSPGAEKNAVWIRDQFTGMNGKLKVGIDSWKESCGRTFHNVCAVYPGREETGKFIIVAAHFDTKKLTLTDDFEGANDGASGVAALITMARALPERSPFPFEIRFLFFDGEEALYEYNDHDGLHGSRRYAGQLKESGTAANCIAMILLDMVGDRDLNVRFPADTEKNLLALAVEVSRRNGTLEQFNAGGPQMLDDHVPFQNLKIPAIDLIDFTYGPYNSYWHTKYDTLDKISGESIAASADFALDLIWELAKKQK